MEVLNKIEEYRTNNTLIHTNKLSLDKIYTSSKLQQIINKSKFESHLQKVKTQAQNIKANISYPKQNNNMSINNFLNNPNLNSQINSNPIYQLLTSNAMNFLNLSYLINLLLFKNFNISIAKNGKNSYIITQKKETGIPDIKQISTIELSSKIVKKSNADKSKINLDINLVLNGTIKDTTIRLVNIPKYFSLIHMSRYIDKILDIKHEKRNRIYNYLRVPLSKKIGKNLGFCFINVIEPKYIAVFYKAFHGKILENCKKKCFVNLADNQIKDVNEIDMDGDVGQRPLIFDDCDNAEEYFKNQACRMFN